MKQVDRHLYRYAEDALRDYPDECERVKLLEEYFCASAGPDESGRVRGGEFVPEQERIVERKMRCEELRGLTQKLACINSFLNTLGAVDCALVRMRYFENRSWRSVAEELHVSEQTCRCYWAPRLIKRAVRLIFGDLAKV